MIEILPENGGYRVTVHLASRIQRTAWTRFDWQAKAWAKEFAGHYGEISDPLPIRSPWGKL